jgi:LuxR family maltose regulon positive regulatory protein
MRIISTRLFPPHKDGSLIIRRGSTQLLSEVMRHRLTLVQAPAGYGKTTAMVSCYESLTQTGQQAAWLSMQEFTGAMGELVEYLQAALCQSVAGFAAAATVDTTLAHGATLADHAADFCNALKTVHEPVFLLLDDFHAIIGSEAEQLVSAILSDSPHNFHLILGTRAEPSFTMGRLRVLGAVGKIDVDDLRFSPEEAQQFISAADGGAMVPLALADLAVRKTEGWPAGLQLVSLALARCADASALLKDFSGSHRDVGNYLAEDVLNRLAPEVQQFLLRTSILNRFCAELCNAVTGRDDARAMLKLLEKSGLFIFSLDDQGHWYRYHHLFSAFLFNQLTERHAGETSTLHRNASRWLAANGLTDEAFQHAIQAGDIDFAAQLFTQAWYELYLKGNHWTLTRWARQLPEQVLARYPKIQLERAWLLTLSWRFEEAQALIDSVAQRMHSHDLATADNGDDRYSLPHLLKHRKMMIAQFTDDMPEVERLCVELLENFPYCDGFLEGSLHVSLLYAQREQYRLADVERLNARARASFNKANAEPGKVWHECILGPALLQLGHFDAAIAGYRNAIEIANNGRIGIDEFPLALVPSLMLAEVQVERMEFDEARTLLERNLPLAQRLGFTDSLIAGYIGRSRLAAIEGDHVGANTVLTEGFEFALTHSLDRLFWNIVSERVRLCLLRDDVIGAVRHATDAGLPISGSQVLPTATMTTKHEAIAITWVRIAMATGAAREALRVLRQWISFAESRGCVRTRIRMEILLARAYQMSGDGRAAVRAIKDAAVAAARIGMVLSFVEEGEPVKSLLLKVLDIDDSVDLAEFGAQLAKALQASVPTHIVTTAPLRPGQTQMPDREAPCEPLNAKEMDILKYVEQSLLNKEIADRLGMTEGSVKWYLQQIYGKLGVRRRHMALHKARQMGYLH